MTRWFHESKSLWFSSSSDASIGRLAFCSSCWFCRMREQAPRAPPAASLRSPQPPCASLRSGGGQTWRRVRGWWPTGLAYCEVGVLLFASVLQNVRTRPPRFALPPRFGGLLGEDLGVEVRVGTLMKLTADLEAPWRKTPTSKKPPVSPHSGGQRRRCGGHVTRSAKPATRSPPLGGSAERSEARGASHTFCTPHNKPPCEPKTAQSTPSLPPSRTQ